MFFLGQVKFILNPILLALLLIQTTLPYSTVQAAESCQIIRENLQDLLLPTLGLEWEGALDRETGTPLALLTQLKKKITEIAQSHPDLGISQIKEAGLSLNFERQKRQYKWVLTQEASILANPKTAHTFELNSPILYDLKDREIFYLLMADLFKFGVKPRPNSAGIHVHMGEYFKGKPELIFNTMKILRHLETALLEFFPISTHRKPYTKSLPDFIFKQFYQVEKTAEQLRLILKQIPDRNFAINLMALDKHGTIEFRLYSSTAQLELLKFALSFADTLALKAQENEQALEKLLQTLKKISSNKKLSAEKKLAELLVSLNYPLEIPLKELLKKLKQEINSIKALDHAQNYTEENQAAFIVQLIIYSSISIFALAYGAFVYLKTSASPVLDGGKD